MLFSMFFLIIQFLILILILILIPIPNRSPGDYECNDYDYNLEQKTVTNDIVKIQQEHKKVYFLLVV